MDVTVEYVSRLTFVKCRYLAVNDIEGTQFHFDQGNYIGTLTLTTTSISIVRPYSSPSPYT